MNDLANIHINILDEERIELLPRFKSLAPFGFYLAGGTGLALQLGHRDSIDFDFFKEGDFDVEVLESFLIDLFAGYDLVINQKDQNTISLVLNQKIKLSFFGIKHKLLFPLVITEYLGIASVLDIACMKCLAITNRSLEKDYIDLYFIFKKISLAEILENCKIKYPNLETSLILKSLVYFEDVSPEQIIFKENNFVSLGDIKAFFQKEVEAFLKVS